MKKLMSNSVAMNFNWAGRKGKIAFKGFAASQIVTREYKIKGIFSSNFSPVAADICMWFIAGAVKQYFKLRESDKTIEDSIKGWLKLAPQRKR